MGQVFLGFRSLLIKIAIFFVLAAGLAWVLGGTLWSRAQTADFPGVSFANRQWFWRLAVGGGGDYDPTANAPSNRIRWTLMTRGERGGPKPFDNVNWVEATGPVVADGSLYFAGLSAFDHGIWQIVRVNGDGVAAENWSMPDRLAVEGSLYRLSRGMPLQSPANPLKPADDAPSDPPM